MPTENTLGRTPSANSPCVRKGQAYTAMSNATAPVKRAVAKVRFQDRRNAINTGALFTSQFLGLMPNGKPTCGPAVYCSVWFGVCGSPHHLTAGRAERQPRAARSLDDRPSAALRAFGRFAGRPRLNPVRATPLREPTVVGPLPLAHTPALRRRTTQLSRGGGRVSYESRKR
jgi:hypothetical protein